GARPDGLASLRRRVPAGARAGPAARRLGRGPSRVAAAYSPGVKRGSRSSWDAVAGWYDATVGVRGSPHHRKAAIPTVMRLADLRRGERVSDVGCGTGVLAFHVVKAGAEYLGVDASSQMILLSRRRRREDGRSDHGGASDLAGTTSAAPGTLAPGVFPAQRPAFG